MNLQVIVLDEVCRVCLSSGAHMSDLFASTYKQSMRLSAMFTGCTSLGLARDDGGPQLICAACLANLIVSHEFREQCLATDETLRRMCVSGTQSGSEDKTGNRDPVIQEVVETGIVIDLQQVEDQRIECENTTNGMIRETVSNENEDKIPLNQLRKLRNHNSTNSTNCPVTLPLASNNDAKSFSGRRSPPTKRKSKDPPDEITPNSKPYKCHICLKTFQQSCTLKDHIRTHSDETPFLCAQCGKGFNNNSNLRQHVRRHNGVKPFKCNQCPMEFACKGGLKSHLTTHTGLKPFSCDVCGSAFAKSYSLVKHRRIHTGERPYQCEMCEMRFNDTDHCKRHMRTHTGEKPYKCAFCERAFAQSNDLVKHKRSHLGAKTYMCARCPAAFRLHGELRAHDREHYAGKSMESSSSSS